MSSLSITPYHYLFSVPYCAVTYFTVETIMAKLNALNFVLKKNFLEGDKFENSKKGGTALVEYVILLPPISFLMHYPWKKKKLFAWLGY